MLRKTLSALVITLVALTVGAQVSTGRWTVYPTVGDYFSNIIETPSRVYALSGGTLMRQNFSDSEFYSYDMTKLSDRTRIKQIKYNYDSRYLLIVYESNNMDMLYDDDTLVNLPEIRDASVASTRNINGVEFYGGKIYVATDFGLVVYDDSRREVLESGVYGKKLVNAFILQDRLFVRTADVINGKNIFDAPLEGRHQSWDVFQPFGAASVSTVDPSIIVLSDNSVLLNYGDAASFSRTVFSLENRTMSSSRYPQFPANKAVYLHPTSDGVVAHRDNVAYFFKDSTPVPITIPQEFNGVFAPDNSGKTVWFADLEKATRYDFSGQEPSVTMTLTNPNGFTVPEAFQMEFSKDGRLYTCNVCPNGFTLSTGGIEVPSYLDRMNTDGTIEDMAVHGIDDIDKTQYSYFNGYDAITDRLNAPMRFAIDPDDPDKVYQASERYGLVVMKNNKLVEIFDKRNSYTGATLPSGAPYSRARTMFCGIDNYGNLWRGNGFVSYIPGGNASLSVLPAGKRKGDLAGITREDWIAVPEMFTNDINFALGSKAVFMKRYPGYSAFALAGGGWGVSVRYDNGTPLDFSDDRVAHLKDFSNPDLAYLNEWPVSDIAEDADGRLWICTQKGVFVLDDIRTAFEGEAPIRRPIVARNDGTVYGDYLLDGQAVYSVAVDPSNRKWFATETGGAYLVSADGTRIIANYNSSNSPLPTDRVQVVACDPTSNRVFFGTNQGIVSYQSDSSPAADDYSNIYVYPNPVRPEYTGWITVTGLMENSLVKIADAAGNVFFQGRSEGGMVSWDGCGPDGQRVRSGIYFVFASSGGDSLDGMGGSSSGAVAKFMVVN